LFTILSLVFFTFSSPFLFSESISQSKNIAFYLDVGTGYSFYGSSSINDENDDISDYSRAIFSGAAISSFRLSSQLRFIAGIDGLGDFMYSGKEHIIRWDYSFLGGIEVFTPIEGLSASVSYNVGRRADFVALKDDEGDLHKNSGSSSWGNGFRFSLDYDFSSFGPAWAPGVGLAWKNMPRGNNRDNTISVYLRLHL
nr:hypothetical protein [Treponema sp.]